MTQLTFSSNFYWNICFKFCILEQIIATVLFICISSINNKRSLLRFQSTTAPTNRGWSACGSTCLPLQDAKWPPQFVYTGDLGTIHLLCKPSSGHWIFYQLSVQGVQKVVFAGSHFTPSRYNYLNAWSRQGHPQQRLFSIKYLFGGEKLA